MNKKYISLIYLYTFLSTFILFYACDTLYYLEKGISSSGYMFFVTISYFIKVILEIPSGILADKYSKKKILFVGNTLFLISTLLFIVSKSYSLFILAIIISSINNCITTGIANSLLYEYNNKNDDFNKLIFRNSFYCNLSYMLAMISGGIIGQKYGLINTYYLTLIPTIINFLIICLIKEPKKNNNDLVINKSIFKNALSEIKNNPIIINMIITNSIIFSIIKIVEESHPDYSNSLGISVFGIGIYTSLILIFSIIGNYIGSKTKKEYYKKTITFNPLFCGLCIFLLGILNSYYGILFLLLFYIFSEIFNNIFLTIVHDSVTSKSRVTIESIISLILCICGLVLSILSSLFLKQIEVYQLYIFLGLIIIIYSIINLVVNKKE